MTRFKKIFILLLMILICANSWGQQTKRVFITLDVSNSMKNNKYELANYTAQVISVFREEGDQVYIYYRGKRKELNNKDAYKQLHIKFCDVTSSEPEIKDLEQFMKEYSPVPNCQDWLFIIGDGEWSWAKKEYEQITLHFQEFIKSNSINVCYLQTGEKIETESQFTLFLEGLSKLEIEILKSDTTIASIRNNTVYFANKILGFSNDNLNLNQIDNTTYSFSTNFPLFGFKLLYQGEGKEPLKLHSATTDGKNIPFHLMGNPSTLPLGSSGHAVIEGAVWQFDMTMQGGSSANLQFSQPVKKDALKVYPKVDVVMHVTPLNPLTKNKLRRNSDGSYLSTLQDSANSKQIVSIAFTDRQGRKFSPEQMKLIETHLYDGIKDYKADYHQEDSTFLVEFSSTSDSISYRVQAEAKGYFMLESETQHLVCLPILNMPVYIFKPTEFDNFSDSVSVLNNSAFQMRVLGKSGLLLLPHSYDFSEKCECAFPDSIQLMLSLMPDTGIVIDGHHYAGVTLPVTIPIDHRPWLVRCKRQLTNIGALLLFSLYLIIMRRKKRFAQSATLIPSYYNSYQQLKQQGPYSLRKRGFGPWFRRWFIPGRESVDIHCSRPYANIKLLAGPTTRSCMLPLNSFDEDRMHINGYNKQLKTKQIKLTSGSTIEINKRDKTKDGVLRFNPGTKDGTFGYRLALLLFILASWVAIAYIIVHEIL